MEGAFFRRYTCNTREEEIRSLTGIVSSSPMLLMVSYELARFGAKTHCQLITSQGPKTAYELSYLPLHRRYVDSLRRLIKLIGPTDELLDSLTEYGKPPPDPNQSIDAHCELQPVN
ncbi:hypothetical protein J4212_05380 [Candidatus Woesearchaeota archaeon]|nr:hypothetical protein [Candidatus Woesearchaeota archaeon]